MSCSICFEKIRYENHSREDVDKMAERKLPVWSKRVNKVLIDRSMKKKDLAQELNVNYNQMINVLSGIVVNENMKKAICEYLGVEY